MKSDRLKNLTNLKDRSPEERKKIASAGGKKSGVAKREKKRMSAIYQEFINSEEGQKLIGSAIKNGLTGNNPTTSLKELREGTEGSKTTLANDEENPFVFTINVNAKKPID